MTPMRQLLKLQAGKRERASLRRGNSPGHRTSSSLPFVYWFPGAWQRRPQSFTALSIPFICCYLGTVIHSCGVIVGRMLSPSALGLGLLWTGWVTYSVMQSTSRRKSTWNSNSMSLSFCPVVLFILTTQQEEIQVWGNGHREPTWAPQHVCY